MYLKTKEALDRVRTLAEKVCAEDKKATGRRASGHRAIVSAVAALEKAIRDEEADRDACKGLET